MTNCRTVSDFLATMPAAETVEAAQFRVEVAWEGVRELRNVGFRPHAVEVGRYFEAAQIQRDRMERRAGV